MFGGIPVKACFMMPLYPCMVSKQHENIIASAKFEVNHHLLLVKFHYTQRTEISHRTKRTNWKETGHLFKQQISYLNFDFWFFKHIANFKKGRYTCMIWHNLWNATFKSTLQKVCLSWFIVGFRQVIRPNGFRLSHIGPASLALHQFCVVSDDFEFIMLVLWSLTW